MQIQNCIDRSTIGTSAFSLKLALSRNIDSSAAMWTSTYGNYDYKESMNNERFIDLKKHK